MIKNKGFVLPVGLVILLIVTMIVILTASSNLTQDKIVSATQDREMAMANTEKALRVAEIYIYKNLNGNSAYAADCTGGLCLPNTTSNVWTTIDWENNTTNVMQLAGGDTIAGAYKQPKYIIEALDSVSNTLGESSKVNSYQNTGLAFRITAVGWGKSNASKVMLQSIYVKTN